MHKTCTKCGEYKPIDDFWRQKDKKDGRASWCKDCKRFARAEYNRINSDEVRAKRIAHYAANHDAYTLARRKYEEANREKLADWRRAYYAANRERMNRLNSAWHAKNRGAVCARLARYYAANTDRAKALLAIWHAANPERASEYHLRRRARKASAPVVERIYRAVVWERDGGKCHICGKKADPRRWHLEHIVPLACGGEHSYRNVAVSHPACNLRKGVNGPAQARLLP